MTLPSKLRVVSLESRQSTEMARLLERHGCEAISAPSMREVPLQDQHEAFAVGERLLRTGCDIMVLLTGVGARVFVDALATRWPREQVIAALARTQLVCRGPKPVAALKTMGLRATAVAPEPNTWRDLLAVMDETVPVADKDVVVQEYGRPSTELIAALSERGARVQSLPVYAWALPEDLAPLREAVRVLCHAQADAVLFTSGQQCEHLFQIAKLDGCEAALQAALLNQVLVASIGPVTSDALREHGLTVDLVPQHPKMGPLVMSLARDGAALLAAKRAGGAGVAS